MSKKEKNTQSNQQSNIPYYKGILGTGDKQIWQDSSDPPINATNLNTIETALIDFLGAGGVVNKLQDYTNYVKPHIEQIDETITHISSTLEGKDENGELSPTSVVSRLSTVENKTETIAGIVGVEDYEENTPSLSTRMNTVETNLKNLSTTVDARIGTVETSLNDLTTNIEKIVQPIADSAVETALTGDTVQSAVETAVDTALEKDSTVVRNTDQLILYCGNSVDNSTT